MVLSLVSACSRNQDQTTPVGQQQGQGSAQDYPSTRNMEQPNPAIGGTNSATNKPAPSGNQEPKPVQPRGSIIPIAPFCVEAGRVFSTRPARSAAGLLAPAFPTV